MPLFSKVFTQCIIYSTLLMNSRAAKKIWLQNFVNTSVTKRKAIQTTRNGIPAPITPILGWKEISNVIQLS